jgi:hypothetical protein
MDGVMESPHNQMSAYAASFGKQQNLLGLESQFQGQTFCCWLV